MAIVARFSNGHVDEYKGRRDVRAGWMVTRRDTGELYTSGHSLDRKRAAGTARGAITQSVGTPGRRDLMFAHGIRMWAKTYGCPANPAAIKAEAARRIEARLAEFEIEIVDVVVD